MTSAELIAKIKAEVEQRINEEEATYPINRGGYWLDEERDAFAIATEYKRFLSFLSTIESEKPIDGLEDEAVSYCFDNGLNLSPRVATDFARHFAQWGKDQMMEEAVEGEVVKDINNKLAVTAKNVNLDKFKFGDKVRVIICKKEDEK